ncbi:DUF4249 family protein [Polluticoccus soli]|uniref:DUF4249 family protein n=1 Tax=Polluticoccus soli TaxID=3034150 RepID=UPI0023E3275D|nr:DUF4249 family protein [Flavipsychrobacter sp. JY13-12]
MRLSHIVCVVLIACVSCNKKLDLPDVERGRKIALLGELVANESVYFRAGQSVPVSSGSSMKFEVLQGLSIDMADNSGMNITLSGLEDSLTKYLHTIPFSSGAIVKPGSVYHISATHPDRGVATTDVTIPDAFTAFVASSTNAVYASDTALAIDVVIEDKAGAHFYVIEAVKQPMTITGHFWFDNQWVAIADHKTQYDSLKLAGANLQTQFDTSFSNTYIRQNLHTADVNTENLKSNSSFNAFRRILLTDYKFSGSDYTTRVYLSIGQNYFTSETDKGRVLLQVKSVSKDYFDYLQAYELYNPNSEYFTSGTPANLKSPVQNGMGVIGGVYKQQFVFVLDKWEF